LFFLRQKHKKDPSGYDNALRLLGTNLHACIRHWQDATGVDRWWVIADDLGEGANVTLQLREEAARWEEEEERDGTTAGGTTRGKLEVYAEDGGRAYDDDEDGSRRSPVGGGRCATADCDRPAARAAMMRILANRRSVGRGGHSNAAEARGPMGHEAMADSLVDWMVLHESNVAIVMQGSFGASGAKGNGKFATVDAAGGGGPCVGLRVFRG
jgi:hypothetical protein